MNFDFLDDITPGTTLVDYFFINKHKDVIGEYLLEHIWCFLNEPSKILNDCNNFSYKVNQTTNVLTYSFYNGTYNCLNINISMEVDNATVDINVCPILRKIVEDTFVGKKYTVHIYNIDVLQCIYSLFCDKLKCSLKILFTHTDGECCEMFKIHNFNKHVYNKFNNILNAPLRLLFDSWFYEAGHKKFVVNKLQERYDAFKEHCADNNIHLYFDTGSALSCGDYIPHTGELDITLRNIHIDTYNYTGCNTLYNHRIIMLA